MVMLNRRSFLAGMASVPLAAAAVAVNVCDDVPCGEPAAPPAFPILTRPDGDDVWSVMWRDPARGYGQVDVPRLPRYTRAFVGPTAAPFWGIEASNSPSGEWVRIFQIAGELPSPLLLVRHHGADYVRNPSGARFMRAYA